jgi:membrane-associated phospholipid phosphatase
VTRPEAWSPLAVWGVPVFGFGALALIAATGVNTPLFLWINRWSLATGPSPWSCLTVLGDTAVALALFTPFALRRPDVLRALAVSAVLATLYVHALKPFFDAARPPGVLPPDEFIVIGAAYKAHSFPSGHTTTAFVAAALIATHVRALWARGTVIALATLVGLSRAVVGVHWPLDIAAGMAGGWLCGYAGAWLSRRWTFGLTAPAQTVIIALLAGCAVALLAGLDTGYPLAVPLQHAIGAFALLALALNVSRVLQDALEVKA